jgi:hypothetical protein
MTWFTSTEANQTTRTKQKDALVPVDYSTLQYAGHTLGYKAPVGYKLNENICEKGKATPVTCHGGP